MDIKQLMNHKFRDFEGGFFSEVTKSDVGTRTADLAAQGVETLCVADPFMPDPSIPENIKKAYIAGIEEGTASHYTMPAGNDDLRRIIAKKLEKKNGLKVDPIRNILISPGSDTGLFFAMAPFIEEGEEVLILDPGYPDNFSNVKLLGGVPISVPCFEEDNWQFRIEEFEKRVTDKTKMVLITHPCNPTAAVYRRENLEKLAKFIVDHNLVLVCDQAFEDHIYDDIEFVTPASLPGMWERTVTVFSVSKGMGFSGFRVGYLVAEDHIMDVMNGCAVNILGATNTAAQRAAIAAFEDDSLLARNYEILEKRRRMFTEIINSAPGVHTCLPESGFLSWVNVGKLGTGAEVSEYLIKEAKVLVNDGKGYGPTTGENYIRVINGVFKDEAKAEATFKRMADAFTKLAKEKGIVE